MQSFKNNLEILLSTKRLSSYNGDIDKHFENLRLIARITPKLATLEICIRNITDFILSKENKLWLENLKDEVIQKELEKIRKKENSNSLSHHQYISRLTLGKFIRIIKDKKLNNAMFDLKNMDFRKYDDNNKNFYIKGKQKRNFQNTAKARIVLNLILTIRNRSYHWENLYKTKIENNTIFPRIATIINNTKIGIAPQHIEIFLDDLIKNINENLLKYCEIEVKHKVGRRQSPL